jgi:hypothetical protein
MIKLNADLFPKKTDDFSLIARIPVLYRPIMGSPERFVVGALCHDANRRHVERANCLSRLNGLYDGNEVGVILAIEVGLDALQTSLVDTDFSHRSYRSPVSGLVLGDEEIVEGRSLEEVAKTWLEAASSLQERSSQSNTPGYVDGATDILHDILARPPVRDMEKVRAGLIALGYPTSKIEEICGSFDGKSGGDPSTT